jgi:hypothetical protein
MNPHDTMEYIGENVLRIPNLKKPAPVVIICRSDDSIVFTSTGIRHLTEERRNTEEFYANLAQTLFQAGYATILRSHDRYCGDTAPVDAIGSYRAQENWIQECISGRFHMPGIQTDEFILLAHGFSGYIAGNLKITGVQPVGYIFASCPYHPYEHILINQYEQIREYISTGEENRKRLFEYDPLICTLHSSLGLILRTVRRNRTEIPEAPGPGIRRISLNPSLWSAGEGMFPVYTGVRSRSLIIHGAADIHVPLGEMLAVEQALRYHGVEVNRVLIVGADHWYRDIPPDGFDQITDLITGEWRKRPFREIFFKKIVHYCNEILVEKRFLRQTGRDH